MKRIIIIFAMAAMLLLESFTASAKAVPAGRAPADSIGRRPKVGVVLSGGGAKGIAHIGVLKLLEELEIPVDYITGTSIGSIIGGLYALGYSADEMQELVLNTDWNSIMKDEISRHQRLYEFNQRDDRMLVDVPIGNDAEVVMRAGLANHQTQENPGMLSSIPLALVEGQNLNSLFTQLSVGYQDSIDFNDLPIPFACVAVDLSSRKPVVIRKGNIVDAMRSSMAIPGYFSPVRKNGMMLVDGGMLDNLPVDVVRGMGADIVIAVDLHKYDKSNFKEPDNLGDMVTSILKILNGDKYRKSVADADLCISPNTGNYSILDFSPKVLTALSDSGYFAALEQISALETISRAEKGFKKEQHIVKKHAVDIHKDSIHISQMQISGVDPKESESIQKRCIELVGEYVDGHELDSLVREFYGTRAFKKVAYSVCNIPGDSSYILKLNFTPEKSHSVGLGFRFDTEEIAALLLNVSLNRHKLYGWRGELDAHLSYNPIISVTGSYAFNRKWQANLSYRFRRSDLTPYEEGRKDYSYKYMSHRVALDFERKGNRSDLRIYHSYTGGIIPNTNEDICYNHLGLGVKYGYDTYDSGYFPTKGIRLKSELAWVYMANATGQDGNKNYGFLNFDVSGVFSLGPKFAVIPCLMGRWLMGQDVNYVGNAVGGYEADRYLDGQMPFAGANYSYFINNLAAVGRVDLRYNIAGRHYVTAIGNILLQTDSFKMLEGLGFNWGVSGGYTYKSVIGPIGLRVHYSDLVGRVGVYLYAGYSF